jgi:membrane protease subunit (stomatin/prohibitin family)
MARGKSMNERQMIKMADAQASKDKYIQQVAAKTASPSEQIANAKFLHDSGAITQAEYDALNAKALA